MKFEEVEIELLEDSEAVSLYSIKRNGNKFTEFEQFLLNNKATHPEDIGTIIYRIDVIKNEGCFERHFRYAGKKRDRTFELPSHFDIGNLRVFCIVISPRILILGNGGEKTTRTYNEDVWLNDCAEFLQKFDASIKYYERINDISFDHKTIKGKSTLKVKLDHENK